jgi:paraquat-inducible protein B
MDPQPDPSGHTEGVANEVESIGEGDPIFYRGLQIGAVGAPHLGSDGTEVLLDALIAPEYASVIRQDTQFWNASGVEIDLGWGGLETQTGPLETLLRGGIQVATPDPPGPRAEPADRFVLREQPDEGWQSWEPVLR